MFEQSRETLPVAGIDVERRIEIAEDIAAQILKGLNDPEGMTDSSRVELKTEYDITARRISALAVEQAAAIQSAA